ncbi:MAG: zinc ribbon domain-containing protein [Chloroflexota bacterium]|nr:zinc ribbon domain-containing protein [Chloroflexota bacterium]
MFCGQCGSPVKSDAVLCEKCGSPAPPAPGSVIEGAAAAQVPTGPAVTATPQKKKRPILGFAVLAVVALCTCLGAMALISSHQNAPGTATAATATPTPGESSTPTHQPTATSAAPAHLTAAQKRQVVVILSGALAHYVNAWHQGRSILGTTQYADGTGGLAAMSDPTSAAARFSAWRASSNIERDVTTYEDAFQQADAYFTAADEPAAISTWMDDMGQLQSDLTKWTTDAVGWQIQITSDAQMTTDVKAITADISAAQADQAAVVAGH